MGKSAWNWFLSFSIHRSNVVVSSLHLFFNNFGLFSLSSSTLMNILRARMESTFKWQILWHTRMISSLLTKIERKKKIEFKSNVVLWREQQNCCQYVVVIEQNNQMNEWAPTLSIHPMPTRTISRWIQFLAIICCLRKISLQIFDCLWSIAVRGKSTKAFNFVRNDFIFVSLMSDPKNYNSFICDVLQFGPVRVCVVDVWEIFTRYFMHIWH